MKVPGVCAWADWKRRTPAMRKSREKMRLCNGTSLLRQKAEGGAYLGKVTSSWVKVGEAIPYVGKSAAIIETINCNVNNYFEKP
jgi:hypothetical protein